MPATKRAEVLDRHAPHFDVDGDAAFAHLHQPGRNGGPPGSA
jgi:hypothetical protein